jgi:addiction module RelE/StbE family toxin
MRKLIWGNIFVRAFKRILKKHPELKEEIITLLKIIEKDCFAPQLMTHKLKGKLSGLWACKAGYDLRIIFELVENDTAILLLEIGSHDEVY